MRTLAAIVSVMLVMPAAAGAQPADDSGFVTRLVRDIASDYKNFPSLDNAETLGVGGFAAMAVHAADQPISDWVTQNNPSTLTGGSEYGSQFLQLPLAVAWWGIAAAAGSERHAETGRDLLRAQISVVSWTYAIKYATDRTRPNGDPRSFPSGHASNSFATAMVLQQHYGWKIGLPAFAAAAYSGISRVYENQHWASDVVFGAAVGIASGRTATLRLRSGSVTFAPLAVPGGGGVLVTALR
jgi:membrane-associated phospholipid phosphatase